MEPGQNLLHYRLIEQIGEGGMGVVWKAQDTTLDREVAIKILPQDVASDEQRLARFEREAKLLASLNHPNVATVYGVHTVDGQPFLAMELVPGEDLAERLQRGRLPLDQTLSILRSIAGALEAAH
nr:protein kinase [Acidobacteriota bacterium]NIO59773.1 protein kinase [Acidobacteriota bacterium]NIQ85929.1 protein kinase [Acidobacteriota bacterium]NIT11472.1 protein kinase [Acidobacteriota bacterium]